jgi:hypothetical protein
MTHVTDTKWSQQVREHGDRLALEHPGAQLPDDEKKGFEKVKDVLRFLYARPSSGRTTALGRRVEKPGERKPGGPSGQTDGSKHDGKHTNK